MRNLILLGEHHVPLPAPGKLLTFYYEGTEDALYVGDTSGLIIKFSGGDFEPEWECSLQEKKLLPVDKKWTFVGFQYVAELEGLCAVLSSGELLLISTNPDTPPNQVGVVDAGIRAARWSPDMELLVLLTGNRTMVLMTKQFDVVAEVDLPHQQAAATSAATAKDTAPVEGISWRGDGQYFVTNTRDDATGKFLLHVWDRKGDLHSTAEQVPLLSSLVSWRPAGPLLASSAPLTAQQQQHVLFFERNGLRHGEFAVRRNWAVSALEWNSASDVLSVLLHDADSKKWCLQLWTTSNYHWYLKQEFEYSARIVSMQWDGEVGGRLRVLSEDSDFFVYNVCFDYSISGSNSAANPSTAAVIDGELLNLTDLRDSVVPPPMSQRRLDAGARAIRHVAFAPSPSRWQLAVARSPRDIALLPARTGPLSRVAHTTEKVQWVPLRLTAGTEAAATARQIALVADDCLLALTHINGTDALFELVFNTEAHEAVVSQFWKTAAPGPVLRLVHNPDTHTTVLHLTDGSLVKYLPGKGASAASLQPWPLVEPLRVSCPYVSTALVGGQERVILLSDRAKLYVDGALVSAEATSFALEQNFLLFTTFSHQLRLLRLSVPFSPSWADQKTIADVAAPAPGAPKQPLQHEELTRAVERGSRIVTAVPHDVKVVLQMPRGNLETVFPRARVLTAARSLLDSNRYRDAFLLLRQQRVDLNLIHDHAPSRFVASLKEIIAQIADVDYLNLLISSLSDDDVTVTMYPDVSAAAPPKPRTIPGKINSVCDAFRTTFQELDAKKYLLCILTAYVKKLPPALEEALALVKQLRDSEHAEVIHVVGAAEAKQPHTVKAESALKYLIFLADVNQLYDIALGMYDFELVMLVAQKSQKDPKEYVPFLESLQKMPMHIQRYTIDRHLKRYGKALAHLSEAGDEHLETALALIKEQKLHALAEQLYRTKSPSAYRAVLEAYGVSLEANNKFEEAAMTYQLASLLSRALDAAKASANWSLLFSIALRLKLTAEERKPLALEMATKLRELGDVEGAAAVLLRHAGDAEQAVQVLCDGGLFISAVHTALEHSLSTKHIESAAVDAADHHLAELNGKITEFERLRNRLAVVRENKRLLPQVVAADQKAGGRTNEEDAVSQFSDTASAISRLTTTTVTTISKTTGKPRRKTKQVRKRLTPREGSPHEEEYLLNTLHELMPTERSYTVMGELLKGLVFFGLYARAKELQTVFSKLISLFEQSKADLLVPPTPPPVALIDPTGGTTIVPAAPATPPRSPFAPPFLPQKTWRLSVLD